MSDSDSLWVMPSEDEDFNLTDNIPDLMEEQCRQLKQASHGRITGRFDRVRSLEDIAPKMQSILGRGHLTGYPPNSNTVDAGELYSPKNYAFEIYSQNYYYRVFEIRLSPMYPVPMRYDEGLLSGDDLSIALPREAKVGAWFNVNSDLEVMDILGSAIKSRKMQFILSRLLKASESVDEDSGDCDE